MAEIGLSPEYPDGARGERLLQSAPRLAELRELAELSVPELSEVSGVPARSITRLEAGKMEPIVRVSRLQAHLWTLTGEDIKGLS